MNDSTNTEDVTVGPPPYISFRTLLNLIERMADEDVPPRIDRSFLSGLSGGYQTQVLAALRSLGLMEDDGRVTTRLQALVDQPEQRATIIGAILRERYPEAIALGEEKATQGQLEEQFKAYGISGATLRKAIAFFLHAANFAGIPVSPFFKTPSATQAGTSTRRRTTRPRVTPKDTGGDSGGGVTQADQLRTRYIEMLMKRVEEQDDIDDRLLDRIEALLGYRESLPPEEDEPQE
jgi:Family of unknown function (DUF5343)